MAMVLTRQKPTQRKRYGELPEGLPGSTVERGMREGRVVQLVVAVPPVAHEVDEDVAPERLPETGGEPGGLDDRLGVVPVDVEDRGGERLAQIRGIPRGPEVLDVVKPSWLLTMMWTVPPVVKPSRGARMSVS